MKCSASPILLIEDSSVTVQILLLFYPSTGPSHYVNSVQKNDQATRSLRLTRGPYRAGANHSPVMLSRDVGAKKKQTNSAHPSSPDPIGNEQNFWYRQAKETYSLFV